MSMLGNKVVFPILKRNLILLFYQMLGSAVTVPETMSIDTVSEIN